MITATEFECGGVRYSCTMFGATKGQALMVKIVKVIGPAIARGVSGLDSDVELGPALDYFCQNVTPTLFAEIAKDFADKCMVYGKSPSGEETWLPLAPIYDDHFAGRYECLLEWLKGCFEVNYASFFGVLKKRISGGVEKLIKDMVEKRTGTMTESPSPLTSTSQSTG